MKLNSRGLIWQTTPLQETNQGHKKCHHKRDYQCRDGNVLDTIVSLRSLFDCTLTWRINSRRNWSSWSQWEQLCPFHNIPIQFCWLRKPCYNPFSEITRKNPWIWDNFNIFVHIDEVVETKRMDSDLINGKTNESAKMNYYISKLPINPRQLKLHYVPATTNEYQCLKIIIIKVAIDWSIIIIWGLELS